MKAVIGTYNSHVDAEKAVHALIDQGISSKHISIIGKAEIDNNNIHTSKMSHASSYVGMGAGMLIGTLTGLGVFAIPGFGFLYGAGAIIGTLGGIDLGIFTGGITTILANVGIEKNSLSKYEDELNEGSFLLLLHGSKDENLKAHSALNNLNNFKEIDKIN